MLTDDDKRLTDERDDDHGDFCDHDNHGDHGDNEAGAHYEVTMVMMTLKPVL